MPDEPGARLVSPGGKAVAARPPPGAGEVAARLPPGAGAGAGGAAARLPPGVGAGAGGVAVVRPAPLPPVPVVDWARRTPSALLMLVPPVPASRTTARPTTGPPMPE